MGNLICDVCGERFAIDHPADVADRNLAAKQADWLGKVLAYDHECQRAHSDKIALPLITLSYGATKPQQRTAAQADLDLPALWSCPNSSDANAAGFGYALVLELQSVRASIPDKASEAANETC